MHPCTCHPDDDPPRPCAERYAIRECRAAHIRHLEVTASQYRAHFKAAEQAFMATKDQYSELARALGFRGDAWFGDPVESHAEVMKRAAAMKEIIRELSEDLAAEIADTYRDTLDWPSQNRRYQRDMDVVHRARSLLGQEPADDV